MTSVSMLSTYSSDSQLTSPDSWQYQSNGNCTNHCRLEGKYAFAVIQYTDCHCSNYVPADQEDISKCQKDCPGYPTEKCGNKDDGLNIYIKIDGNNPSGTLGGSSSTAAATSAPAATSQALSSQAPTVSISFSFRSHSSPFFIALFGHVHLPARLSPLASAVMRTVFDFS